VEEPGDTPVPVAAGAARLRLAIVEVRDPAADTAANLRDAIASLASAADAGAELVVFPELYLSGYYLDHAMARRAAETAWALDRLQAAVDENEAAAVVGAASLGSRGPGGPPFSSAADPLAAPLPSGDLLLDTAAVLRPHREPAYAVKAHLYADEEEWFTPGHGLWTGRIAGWPCGIAICYELGFPEVARSLALAGARLLLVPAAFGASRIRIWDVLTRARAIENGCYLAAAAQSGTAAGREFLGRSRVVDPYGEIVADGSLPGDLIVRGGHTICLADLDAARVASARRGDEGWHRSLGDRRPGLYTGLSDE
jgi:predicted amidohydrolase